MSPQTVPYAHLGSALATDYFFVREQFTEEQWEHFLDTRRFVDREVLPAINEYWEAAELPWPLMRRLPELGLLGEDIQGYGCPGLDPLARGLVFVEHNQGRPSAGRRTVAGESIAPDRPARRSGPHWLVRTVETMRPCSALVDVGGEEVASPWNGLDEVAVATERLPNTGHLEAQVALFHDGRGPYLPDDGLLGDQRAAGLHQGEEEIEGAAPEGDGRAVRQKHPGARDQAKAAEPEHAGRRARRGLVVLAASLFQPCCKRFKLPIAHCRLRCVS